jgi:hypothetical protein
MYVVYDRKKQLLPTNECFPSGLSKTVAVIPTSAKEKIPCRFKQPRNLRVCLTVLCFASPLPYKLSCHSTAQDTFLWRHPRTAAWPLSSGGLFTHLERNTDYSLLQFIYLMVKSDAMRDPQAVYPPAPKIHLSVIFPYPPSSVGQLNCC